MKQYISKHLTGFSTDRDHSFSSNERFRTEKVFSGLLFEKTVVCSRSGSNVANPIVVCFVLHYFCSWLI